MRVNLSIRTRLFGLVAIGALGLAILVSYVYATTETSIERSAFRSLISDHELLADVLPPPMFALEVYTVSLQIQTAEPAAVGPLNDRLEKLLGELETRNDFWQERVTDASLRDRLKEAHETAGILAERIRTQVVAPVRAGDRTAAAAALAGPVTAAYEAHRAAVERVVERVNENDVTHSAAAVAELHGQLKLEIIVAVVMVLVMGVVGFSIVRTITKPLAQSVATMAKIEAGDLTQRLAAGDDELGRMSGAINASLDAIESTMRQVQALADAVNHAARELASASSDISGGAQQQASGLEESAASIEEMTATIKQSADNARQASQLALASRDAAEKGGQVVAQAVGAMGEINQASKRIAEIITAIDEIAFQTNLLALNAAVEAARAGEQGRGFAVVAAEVRGLAQRSATAAKEIKGLIQDSVKRVEVGSELVTRSGDTLTEIVSSVKRVTDIVTEMASTAREQSTGIDQINRAITSMDQVTQSNAAQTEELSATARGLSDQAEEVRKLLERFKVSGGSGPSPRVAQAETPRPSKISVVSARKSNGARAGSAARPSNGHNGHNGANGVHAMDALMAELDGRSEIFEDA